MEPDSYTPTPADVAEFYRLAHPCLNGLKALLVQSDHLAADAKRNYLTKARGKAEHHQCRGLAVAYTNAGVWLRLELARLEV